jgi:DNA-binding SARP family transcriptional activator/tetratricopeptide (TPR) repeat protein
MEFRVLGPVEVWHDGHSVPFARRQQRVVLAILALRANETVSRDQLIDLIWGERPPDRARAVVHSRVSEVRATLNGLAGADSTLWSASGGYLLETPPDRVDAHRFSAAVAGWRGYSDEVARVVLRDALALWRGPVAGGWLPAESQATLSQALDAARLRAAEDFFDIELRLGNHVAVADEILRLCDANPTRERLIGQVLLALSRAGRGAEALQRFDQWRRRLRDTLGTDPGPELQALHVSVLRGEASPAAGSGFGTAGAAEPDRFTSPLPRILPPDIADFSGRAREVAQLRALLRADSGQGMTIVAVTGPGGAGKTALSVHVAHGLAGDFPDGQLYANLHGVDRDRPADPFEVLGRFLRALGVDGLGMPDTIDERTDLYRGLLAGRRAIVVLDNAAGDDQVAPLIPGGPTCRVIVTSRARLGTTISARMLRLDVMDSGDAVGLLAQMAGSSRVAADPDAAADLARCCGHLPLALRVVGAKLAAKPHWSVAKLVGMLDDERTRLDRLAHGHLDVRASIELSYAGLGPQAQGLLRRLGHLDLPEASVWLSSALLDARLTVAEELLEQLFDAQLLDFAGRDAGDYPRYRLHDLVRLFARERALMDETAAELAAARDRAFGAYLFMADTLLQSLYGGDYLTVHGPAPRWPVDVRSIGASVTELLLWFDVEHTNIVAMVQRGARDGLAAASWDLACTASLPFPMRRRFDEWQSMLEAASDAVESTGGEHDERGRAAILYRMGTLAVDRQDFDRAWSHLTRAEQLFRHSGDPRGEAIVEAFLAMIERFRGDPAAALRRYETALNGLEAAADRGGVAFVLRSIGQTHMNLGDEAQADTYFERALAAHRDLGGSPVGGAQVLLWRGMLRLRQQRFADAEQLFAEVLAATRVLGDRHGQAQALRGLGICYHRHGKDERARAALAEALQLVRQPRPSLVEAHVRQTIAELFGDR